MDHVGFAVSSMESLTNRMYPAAVGVIKMSISQCCGNLVNDLISGYDK